MVAGSATRDRQLWAEGVHTYCSHKYSASPAQVLIDKIAMIRLKKRADSERRSEVDRGGRLWFSFARFLQAIAALGAGAVPGSDGVTSNMIKCLSISVLHSFYQLCVNK